jgi:HAD superfamily hydrolase (TIGR01549 family)
MVMDYFKAQGWVSAPWEHAALYDVFAAHSHDFDKSLNADELRAFAGRIARTLFRRLDVQADSTLADVHGEELWRILGPAHLAPFPDAKDALRQLRAFGFRLAVTSNWQYGLKQFCSALGMGEYLDVVVASAEIGAAKPDVRIFEETCRRLGFPPARVLHVGDSRTDDVDGAQAAGLQALWLCRRAEATADPETVRGLDQLVERLGTKGFERHPGEVGAPAI